MLSCILIRRKLYEFYDNSLSEKENIKINAHLKKCPECAKKLREVVGLIEFTRDIRRPLPSEDFWYNFKNELDAKLNRKLGGMFQVKRNEFSRLKPAIALLLAAVIMLMAGSVFFNRRAIVMTGNDLELINEVNVLEEVILESNFVLYEDSYIEEMELLARLSRDST